MAKRSLKASTIGITQAKQAFERKGWTQEYLAAQVGLETRHSVWKFFRGKPIDRAYFIDICFQLDLDWQDIADFPPTSVLSTPTPESNTPSQIDAWVQLMRSQLQDHIQVQAGILQSSFDVTQPLLLDHLYTHVKILPHLTHQRWLEVSDLQGSQPKGCDRVRLTQLNQPAIPGMEAVMMHSKLTLLGKPGAGKTTFLQYLALQCNAGHFKPDCIPVFISLRQFTKQARTANNFSFLNYLSTKWKSCGISPEQIEPLLQHGKVLLLLDGLDEVSKTDTPELLQQIQLFADEYYQNQIIITSRIAAQQYHFRGFTYVELADFDAHQIETFAQKWFTATNKNYQPVGLAKASQFLEQLHHPDNQPIRELVVTPILLSLVCSVFQERATFPSKRAKLYQAGLDILLVRWDKARGIQRDQTYRNLQLPDKIKLLSQIAATMFAQGNYFFEKSEVLPIISDYLQNLPNSSQDLETLWLTSTGVLKAIELQHGLLVERARDIYSFSHLTFQEYLTARKIVATQSTEALQQLATHITDSQWKEVFLLTVSLLPTADLLLRLIKEEIDNLVKDELQIQTFIDTIYQKVNQLQTPYHPAALRAFYWTLFQDRDLNLTVSLDAKLAQELPDDLALDLTLARALDLTETLIKKPTVKQILNLEFALDFERTFQLDKAFQQSLQQIKAQLPDPAQGKEGLQAWWQINGEAWLQQFRASIIEHRAIGQDWQFSQDQWQRLQQYYQANQFLVDCLNSEGQVSAEVRAEIENNVLIVDEGSCDSSLALRTWRVNL
jgi:predicted NACHT family NTPase